jgi:nucleotide-binding universal stress UspA family protein
MRGVQVTPPLAGKEHDSDGRLVGLMYDSTPPLQATSPNLWLVALDGSDNALRATAYAAAQGGAMKTCVLHLIHVQPWLSKEAAEAELAHRGLGLTARGRSLLDAAGLPWRLHVVIGDPAEHIFEKLTQLRASTLVIGSRGLNALESVVFGSVAYKAVHRSPVPVVVVP